ncbi:MAG: SMC-Scp complex subunit ScpB [Methanosarcinales archaeon]|nr:SMC-Scp complex subunit ScpB [Methanosarcinales archaeon]
MLGDDHARRLIEAALFAAGRSLAVRELAALPGLEGKDVASLADGLVLDYRERDGGVEIRSFDQSYVMQVRPELAPEVMTVAPREIDAPLLRTLAIIAYRQPICQSDLARIRGNKSYQHVRELEQMGLITAVKVGRTKELRTSKGFADYFGLEGDGPEFVRRSIGLKRDSVGVTPMFESLGRRMGLDYVVVNPYHPSPEDRERLPGVDLLVLSPGYSTKAQEHYSGDLIEARARTFSQLKESIELICDSLADCPDVEPLLAEIDSLLLDYRERAVRAAPINPLTEMIREMAEDLRMTVSEDGISAAPDYTGQAARIIVPTHQDYAMDILERIKQRYEALLQGAAGEEGGKPVS